MSIVFAVLLALGQLTHQNICFWNIESLHASSYSMTYALQEQDKLAAEEAAAKAAAAAAEAAKKTKSKAKPGTAMVNWVQSPA